ncbi:hypothetical protein [Haloferula sp. BvORR071]|uniref:hypothetical protein n=1 Tax=Haloferula sp. BvORR071 TaxID=1396141 RepID=UPI000550EE25|nr:hypothetical protein [Haloferula sp. BvORR071]
MKTPPTKSQQLARDAVQQAAAYLLSCGIRVPRFTITTKWDLPLGGSEVVFNGTTSRLNMGRYPTSFLRNWFAMHELGHVLWNEYRPLHWKKFREAFGEPAPADYLELYRTESWKTAASGRLSWLPGPHRPPGEPSWYGARAGGQERFCELIALMYASEDFAEPPPTDLRGLWQTCWDHGLSRMT